MLDMVVFVVFLVQGVEIQGAAVNAKPAEWALSFARPPASSSCLVYITRAPLILTAVPVSSSAHSEAAQARVKAARPGSVHRMQSNGPAGANAQQLRTGEALGG